ncbi:methionyl-tRNA formyltransferase [Microbacterium sp. JB110]|uniref:methionyl-tRNA formyltransferase n=1 Tax=Microbacterium sp. JB110 TaxID=2024477 RepID=UPI00097F401F|nr:methionyl-tRNA formyltransferase [Microbacterium sp. JB110]RCS62920.1 methionyl-tRNA formyltransferase [Microbacterium sp. JB110]SJM61459.1 Methionyl-tRNA formyltransferase [Frigoribacterium sp. JB110]
MRLIFAGTPDAAVPTLRALHAAGHDIRMVVTRPDAPIGRRRVMTPSPVARAADELGLPVLKAARLGDEATEELVALGAELAVVVAYGGLVREPLLSAPDHGWINLHFSLLPRWRGAAPVQRALIAGDRETGAAVFRLVPELDAGDVYAQLRHEIAADATAADLLAELAESGAQLVTDVVEGIADGTAAATAQHGEQTHAAKLALDDGRVRWDQTAAHVLDRHRGVTPEPGSHTTVAGERLKIHEAAPAADAPELAPGELAAGKDGVFAGTGDGAVLLTRVQPAGKGAMNAADWFRGQRGDVRLGS